MKTAERASKGSQSWIEFFNQWFEWTLIDCAEICCWEYFMPLRCFLSYLRLSSLCLCNWKSLSQLYFNRIVISSFSSYLCGKVDGKGRPNIVHISKINLIRSNKVCIASVSLKNGFAFLLWFTVMELAHNSICLTTYNSDKKHFDLHR